MGVQVTYLAGVDLYRPRAGGDPSVLTEGEIRQLVEFARSVPRRFPSLRDEAGRPVAADVEFAFKDGRLTLLQMRPFVESKGAQSSRFLAELDAELRAKANKTIRLDQAPRG